MTKGLVSIFVLLMYFSAFSQTVVNGGFDNGAQAWIGNCPCNSDGNCIELNPETVYGGAVPGNLVAEIDGHNNSSTTEDDRILCQSVSCFIIGQEYTLSFLAARRSSIGTPDPLRIIVEIDDGVLQEVITRTGPFNFIQESFNFIATQNTHLITFKPDFRGSLGMLVDDIAITPAYVLEMDPIGPLCSNGQETQLFAQPTGGMWSGAGVSTTGLFDPVMVGPGIHVVNYIYSQAINCPAVQESFNIEVINEVVAEIIPIAPICENEGVVILNASPPGGVWGAAVNSNILDLESLGPGVHDIEYLITGDCTSSDTIQIEILELQIPDVVIPDVICEGEDLVVLNANPPNGIWSGAANGLGEIMPTDLGAGLHQVSYDISSINLCADILNLEIEILPEPQISFLPVSGLCQNHDPIQLEASPSGGVWGGVANNMGWVNPSTLDLGIHLVTYQLSNVFGCIKTDSIEIEILEIPKIEIDPIPSLCNNEPPYQVVGSPVDGTYSGVASSNGWIDPALLSPGLYTVYYSLVNNNSCFGIDSTTVEVKAFPEVFVEEIDPICNDASVINLNFDPPGGSWSDGGDGSIDPTNYDPGIYNLTYTFLDASGCQNQTSIEFEILSSVEVEIFSIPDLCENDGAYQVQVNPNGGTFSGDVTPSGTIEPSSLGAGTYQLSYYFVNLEGCGDSVTISYNIIDVPEIFFNNQAAYCLEDKAETLIATPVGGTWNGDVDIDGSFNPQELGQGIFEAVYIYEFLGCITKDSFMFEIQAFEEIVFGEQVFCENAGLVNLTASPDGGIWSGSGVSANGTLNVNDLIPGDYSVSYFVETEISPGVLCQKEQNLDLTIVASVDAGESPGVLSYCIDGTSINLWEQLIGAMPGGKWTDVSIDPTAGFNNGILNTQNLKEGSYTFRYDILGELPCMDDSSVIVVQLEESVSAGMILGDLELCEGDDAVIDLFDLIIDYDPGGIWKEVNLGSFQILLNSVLSVSELDAGIHTFEYLVESSGLCSSDSIQVQIEINGLPIADAGDNQQLDCDVRSVIIGGSSSTGNQISYNWSGGVMSPNGITTQVTEAGDYTITVTNTSNSCFAIDEVTVIDQGPGPEIEVFHNDISCFGNNDGQIIVSQLSGGLAPFTYALDQSESIDSNEFTALSAGTYTVFIEDANGCQDSMFVTIDSPAELMIELASDLQSNEPYVFYGDSVQLMATVNTAFDSLFWFPSQSFAACDPNVDEDNCLNQWVFPTSQSTYEVMVINEQGCIARAAIEIEVLKDFSLYIPNVFSPNNDGINDAFRIHPDNNVAQISSFRIYDRWGSMVFNKSNLLPSDDQSWWDGSFKSKKLNPGIFVYDIQVEFKDGSSKQFIGDVTILY